MKRKSAEEIIAASKPRDIFTMNADTIEQEKDEYIERFKPQEYSAIKNFVVTQKIILLYRQALFELGECGGESDIQYSFTIRSKDGKEYVINSHYAYDIKIGKMYVTEKNVVFVISDKYKKYYENYIEKTKSFPMLNKKAWEQLKYMFPKIHKYFEDEEGNGVIVTMKPCNKIYPLREILNYFDGKVPAEYVASMITRLYNFVCYLELMGINHNGITIDNLFFAPGRMIEEGEDYTVEDMRIIGVFGGWFFTTSAHEKITGLPHEIYEILPKQNKESGFSSFEVDELSIKRVARELLGDYMGEDLICPKPFSDWVNRTNISKNAYEEFCAWENVRKLSFGKSRFVEMDVSID